MKLAIFLMISFLGNRALDMGFDHEKYINICQNFIVNDIGLSLPASIDNVVVQRLKLTSNVAFYRGMLGDKEVAKDNRSIFFVCSLINETGEVIMLNEPGMKLHYKKETPLTDEYSNSYVDNDKAFFNLYIFSRNDGGLILKKNAFYNNSQLYKYYTQLGIPSVDDFKSVDAREISDKDLVGTWYLMSDNVINNCYQSIGLSIHNNFSIGNQCDEIPSGSADYDEKQLLREAGKWHIDKGVLILNRDRIYRDNFLSLLPKTVYFKIILTDNASKLILTDTNNNRLVFLKPQ